MRRYNYLIAFLLIAAIFVFPKTSDAAGSTRLGGHDRFDVAVSVANAGWQTSNTVVLANYLTPFDALSASPLAHQLQAPILLTQTDDLTQTTKDEITKLQAKSAVVIGGEASVSQHVLDELTAMGLTVNRIGGHDRYEVAKNIADKMPNKQNAILANGLVFADSLSIAPYAASKGYPILLTYSDNIPQFTKDAMNGRSQVTVVGGPASVNDDILNAYHAQRIGGHDRYEVATNIITQLGMPTSKVYLATGMTFADALTGSVLAAKDGAPMLLTESNHIPDSLRRLAYSKGINNVVVLGGTSSVSDDVVSKLGSPLAGMKIVLDAGHGGWDPGAIAVDNQYESTLNYSFTNIMVTKLKAYGADVLTTRSGDQYVSLQDRANFANSNNADLFISFHHNVGPGGVYYSTYRPGIDRSGIIVTFNKDYQNSNQYPWLGEDTPNQRFVYSDHGVTKSASYDCDSCTVAWAFDLTPSPAANVSKDLASKVASAMQTTGISNDGVHNQDLYVTRWTNMPSILVELGNIKNSTELSLLEDINIKYSRASKITGAIINEFN